MFFVRRGGSPVSMTSLQKVYDVDAEGTGQTPCRLILQDLLQDRRYRREKSDMGVQSQKTVTAYVLSNQ